MGILTLTARVSKSTCLTPQIYFKTSPKGTRPQMGSGAPRFGAHPLITSQALPSGLSEGSQGAALDQVGCQKYSQKTCIPRGMGALL